MANSGTSPTERRALAAALDAPTSFRPRAGAGAMRAADAVVGRWAPDGVGQVSASGGAPRAGSRWGAMASLAFADRMLSGWMAASDAGLGLRGMNLMLGYARDGFATRHVPAVSWLMPRPAYLDELAWIAASRAAASAARTSPVSQVAAPSSMALGYVAPDLASAAGDGRDGAGDEPRQVWSPSLPAGVSAAMDAWALADAVAATPTASGGVATRRPAFGANLARAMMMKAAPATTTTTTAPRRAALAGLADSLRAYVLNPAEHRAESQVDSQAVNQADVSGSPAPAVDEPRPSRAPATAYELLVTAMQRGEAPATVAGPRLALPAGLGGAVLSARVDAALAAVTPQPGGDVPERSPMAIAPRVASAPMPMPMASVGAPSRFVGPATLSALASPPAALRHVAWSDRWLARLAGASPATLEQFAMATGQRARAATVTPALPLLQVLPDGAAPSPVAAAGAPSRAAAAIGRAPSMTQVSAPAPAPSMAVRAIDDNEATPDDVFMAIATARGRGRAPVATVPSALTPVTFAPTPSAADRLLGAPATMATGAGLASALVASPVAAALRGAIGAAAPGTQGHRTPTPRSSMLTAPVDVRSLSPAAVAMAYLALPADLGPSIGTSIGPSIGPSTGTSRGAMAFVEGATAFPSVAPGAPGGLAGASWSPAPVVDADARPVERARAGGFAPVFTFASAVPDVLADGGVADGAAPIGARPGDLAERATELGHATELSAAELSFDFVAPETVLAARGYGLPAGDAMMAERLGRASTGTLLATAAAVEQRFVHAVLADRDAAADADGGAAGPARRLPRGAFLWPAAALGSLGVQALGADPARLPTVVALELLAAQAVAAVGESAAASATQRRVGAGVAAETPALAWRGDVGPDVAVSGVAASAPSLVGAYPNLAAMALGGPVMRAAVEHLQAGAPGALAPAAARAMALVSQGGDDGGDRRSARERAQQAWSVLPVVYAGSELARRGGPAASAPGSTVGASPGWALGADTMTTLEGGASDDSRGDRDLGPTARGPLAARAGTALRSYVATSADGAPATTAVASSAASSGYRVPSAAPELVRPGTSPSVGPRFGGGELEIPAWFESAARKMLEERSPGSDLSLADLTLVTAAPATALAASTKSTTVSSASAATAGSATSSTPDAASAPDLERLAREVYDQFLQLMDVARWRNYGDR